MDYAIKIKEILSATLGLGNRLEFMDLDTFLIGNIPELDSTAVITIILELEINFSISIRDDEVSAQTFQTLGSLISFVEKKVAESNKN